jgi:putative tryptophan/tyrosine transport system substrate-binding protein
MRRREFTAFLGGAAFAWPLPAWARQAPTRTYRIGYLAHAKLPHLIDALQKGLRELGYIEGQNLNVEYRFGSAEMLDALATELVRLNPDAIVTVAMPAAMLRSGVVESLARPGGNVTGVTLYGTELTQKRIEVFKEALPSITHLAVLANARNPYHEPLWQEAQIAGHALGIAVHLFNVKEPDELTAVFATMARDRADGLLVLSDAQFNAQRHQVGELAAKHRLPAMYEAAEFVKAGGLMSYGPDIVEMSRRSAPYIDKVLTGTKPADLPIEQPTRFDLVINLRTAKALDLKIPPTLLVRADEVIE